MIYTSLVSHNFEFIFVQGARHPLPQGLHRPLLLDTKLDLTQPQGEPTPVGYRRLLANNQIFLPFKKSREIMVRLFQPMITQTAQRLDSHFCIALQPFHQVRQNDYVLIFFDDYSTFSTFANIVPTLPTGWSHFQPSMLLLLPLLKLHDIVLSLPSKHHILAPPSEPTLFSGVPPRIPQSHLKIYSSPQFIQPEFFEKKRTENWETTLLHSPHKNMHFVAASTCCASQILLWPHLKVNALA